MNPALATLLLLLPSDTPPPAAADSDFVLKIRPIHLMEGGPLTVELELECVGSKTLVVDPNCLRIPGEQLSVHIPERWERLQPVKPAPLLIRGGLAITEVTMGRIGLRSGGTETIGHGSRYKQIVHLHHKYKVIPPGKAKIQFTWHITGERWQRLAKATTCWECDIPRASPERLRSLKQSFENMLAGDKPIDTIELSKVITNTRHHDVFLPLCFTLMRSYGMGDGYSSKNGMLRYVYASSRESASAHKHLIEHLRDYGTREDRYLFQLWKNDRVSLTQQDVDMLHSSRDLWIKVMTAQTFPDKCSKERRASIREQIDLLRQALDEIPNPPKA